MEFFSSGKVIEQADTPGDGKVEVFVMACYKKGRDVSNYYAASVYTYNLKCKDLPIGGWLKQGGESEVIMKKYFPVGSPELQCAIHNSQPEKEV
jgi:hypothetical protein